MYPVQEYAWVNNPPKTQNEWRGSYFAEFAKLLTKVESDWGECNKKAMLFAKYVRSDESILAQSATFIMIDDIAKALINLR